MTSKFHLFRVFALSLAVFIGCLGIVSCSSSESAPVTSGKSGKSGETPEFTGPWAAEFSFNFAHAPSDMIREILQDGEINDMEKQAIADEFRTCLASQGVTFEDFKPDGGFDFEFEKSVGPGKANVIADDCSKSSGVDDALSLYYMMRANPDNTDVSEAIAACLVRSGTVPPDYSAEDYRSQLVTEVGVGNAEEAIAATQDCEANPEGAFSD